MDNNQIQVEVTGSFEEFGSALDKATQTSVAFTEKMSEVMNGLTEIFKKTQNSFLEVQKVAQSGVQSSTTAMAQSVQNAMNNMEQAHSQYQNSVKNTVTAGSYAAEKLENQQATTANAMSKTVKAQAEIAKATLQVANSSILAEAAKTRYVVAAIEGAKRVEVAEANEKASIANKTAALNEADAVRETLSVREQRRADLRNDTIKKNEERERASAQKILDIKATGGAQAEAITKKSEAAEEAILNEGAARRFVRKKTTTDKLSAISRIGAKTREQIELTSAKKQEDIEQTSAKVVEGIKARGEARAAAIDKVAASRAESNEKLKTEITANGEARRYVIASVNDQRRLDMRSNTNEKLFNGRARHNQKMEQLSDSHNVREEQKAQTHERKITELVERELVRRQQQALMAEQKASQRPGGGGVSVGGFIGRGLAVAGVAGTVDAIQKLVATQSQLEQLEKSLNNVTGSAAKGAEAFDMLHKFDKETPFNLEQAGDAYVRLKNYGIEPTREVLNAFGNAAARTKDATQSFTTITTQLGQAWAKGKLQGQDMRLIMEAGIPVMDILGNRTGKTSDQIAEFAHKGLLGRDAITLLIDEMGKLYDGTMEDRMKSFDGQFGIFKGNILSTVDDIRKSGGLNSLTNSFKSVNDYLDKLRSEGKIQKYAVDFVNATTSMLNAVKMMAAGMIAPFNIIYKLFYGMTDTAFNETHKTVGFLEGLTAAGWLVGKMFTALGMAIGSSLEGAKNSVSLFYLDIKTSFTNMGTVISAFGRYVGEVLGKFKDLVSKAMDIRVSNEEVSKAYSDLGSSIAKGILSGADKIKLAASERNLKIKEAQMSASEAANDAARKHEFKMLYDPTYANEHTPQSAPAGDPAKKGGPLTDLVLKPGKEKKGRNTFMNEAKDEYQTWLTEQKALAQKQGKIFEDSIDLEVRFWTRKLAEAKKGSDNYRNAHTKLEIAKGKKIDEQQQETQQYLIAQAAIADTNKRYAEEISLLAAAQNMYSTTGKKYQEFAAKIAEAKAKDGKQAQQIADQTARYEREKALEVLDDEEEIAKRKMEEREIDKEQYFAILEDIENRRRGVKTAEVGAEQAADEDPSKAMGYARRIESINRQSSKTIGRIHLEASKDANKYWDDFSKNMADSFSSNIDKMARGQLKFGQAVRFSLGDMLLHQKKMLLEWGAEQSRAFIKTQALKLKELFFGKAVEKEKTTDALISAKAREIAQLGGMDMLSAKAMAELGLTQATETAKTTTTIAGEESRVAAKAAGGAQGTAIEGAFSVKSIMMSAWKALAATYSAIASIPIVGPVLAPVAAAGAFAFVAKAASRVVSAEGGYRVPSNVAETPALIHKDEKVLPASEAKMNDEMYRIMKSGGGVGGNRVTHNHNWNFPGVTEYDGFRSNQRTIERRQNKINSAKWRM